MQDDRLIAFANKSLTDAEKRYANVERERTTCNCVCTYLLGRSFIAESNHKPLEEPMKNLANAPPHLQQMLIQLERYNITIRYRPGKEMLLANA